MSETWTRDLLTGLAEHLRDLDLVDWRGEDTVYTPPYSGPIAALRQLPDGDGVPDAACALDLHAERAADNADLSNVVVTVHLVWRGDSDPFAVDGFADAAWTRLQGARGVRLGEPGRYVYTALIRRDSSARLGQDANWRWIRRDIYHLTASRPNAWRTD